MRKLILTATLWVIGLLMAVASNVSEQNAKLLASEFLKSHLPAGTRAEAIEPVRVTTGVADGPDAGIYVFNAGDAFVVMSASDLLPAVLAYGTAGSFDPQTAPPAMKSMLRAMHYAAKQATTRASVPTHDAIAPMTKTEWDQTAPYNAQCPVDETTGETSVTGCVATAMAQLMYYHQWPAAYDWGSMKTSYKSTDTSAAADAVAKLMVDCGKSVFMKYGSITSGTASVYISEALRNNFGYAETTERANREYYTAESWDALIYGELSQKRPVVYSGMSVSSGQGESGHAFVIDGYDGKGYYHVNWGWGGQSNDYFLLSVLDPEYTYTGGNAGSSGYSYGQEAVVGIQPAAEPLESTSRLYVTQVEIDKDKGTYTRASTSDDFESVVVNFTLYNMFKETAQLYDIGVGLYQGHTLVKDLDFEAFDEAFKHYNGWAFNTDPIVFGSGLADGVYQIRAMCRETGKSQKMWCFGGIDKYVELTISGTTMTTKTFGQENDGDADNSFVVNSAEVSGSGKVGEPMTIKLNVTDKNRIGNAPIFIWGNASLSEGADKYQLLAGGGTNLDPGETGDVVLQYTPQRAGDFKFIVSASSENCKTSLYEFTASVTGTFLSLELEVDDSKPLGAMNEISTTAFKGVGKISNYGSEPYNDKIAMLLAMSPDLEEPLSKVSQQNVSVTIPVGGTADVPFNYTDLTPGAYYVLIFAYKDGTKTMYLNQTEDVIEFKYIYRISETASGIDAIRRDAPDADVYDMRGVRLGKASELESLPKGIYIINKKKVVNK